MTDCVGPGGYGCGFTGRMASTKAGEGRPVLLSGEEVMAQQLVVERHIPHLSVYLPGSQHSNNFSS